MTRFFLIRHGATDTVGKAIAGRAPGVHLNELGRRQAESLAVRLGSARIDQLYSSPLERAVETAQPLAERRALEIRLAPKLAELDFGQWTGKTIEDLNRDPAWGVFNRFRSATRAPGGELMLEAQQRIVSEVESLNRQHAGKTVAFFSHADVIRAAILFYLGMPLDLFHRVEIAPASVSILHLYDDGAQIMRLNDTGDPLD
jgi:probable phosphoglycerate mutase